MSIVERSLAKMRGAAEPAGPRAPREPKISDPSASSQSDEYAAAFIVPPLKPASPSRDEVRNFASIEISREVAVRRGLMVDAELAQRLAPHMRVLKRHVLSRASAAPGRAGIVLVTSAVPGDGKTFTAFNLAVALAGERSLCVTLVDCDLVRQTISRALLRGTEEGVGQCVSGDATLDDVTYRTSIPGLSFVPAGSPHSESLPEAGWDRVAAEMHSKGTGHLFVVDTAPLLAAGDAQALAQRSDSVVFVVRAGVTPAGAVDEALQQLSDRSRVALVLNGGVDRETGTYYAYDYHQPRSRAADQPSNPE